LTSSLREARRRRYLGCRWNKLRWRWPSYCSLGLWLTLDGVYV
jgi:hypothetical protein